MTFWLFGSAFMSVRYKERLCWDCSDCGCDCGEMRFYLFSSFSFCSLTISVQN